MSSLEERREARRRRRGGDEESVLWPFFFPFLSVVCFFFFLVFFLCQNIKSVVFNIIVGSSVTLSSLYSYIHLKLAAII